MDSTDENQRIYEQFFANEKIIKKYVPRVINIMRLITRNPPLIIDINDVRTINEKAAETLLNYPEKEIPHLKTAFRYFVNTLIIHVTNEADRQFVAENLHKSFIDYVNQDKLNIGFEGSFGVHHLIPMTIKSQHLNTIVCLEGIVTSASPITAKSVKTVLYTPKPKNTITVFHKDFKSATDFPITSYIPKKDDSGSPMELDYGQSQFVDCQYLTIQDLPKHVTQSKLPTTVQIYCEDYLVSQLQPGSRGLFVGVLRAIPGKCGGYLNKKVTIILIANNIMPVEHESVDSFITDELTDERKLFEKLLKQYGSKFFELLSRSLAPSIHGNFHIKEALLCQLIGGAEKIVQYSNLRIRGEINLLLIGDPAIGKSLILRYAAATSPRAITTTGRGSSGVGLTAAITTDPRTKERRLEAGGMVLADKGLICIDEFEKMNVIDRTAIHEAMEQGSISINKADFHVKLNARCSVLAAANAIKGNYDPSISPMDNIGLPSSILSRFDLVFALSGPSKDEINDTIHKILENHTHQEKAVIQNLSTLSTINLEDSEVLSETNIYEECSSDKEPIFKPKFIKAFIKECKTIKNTEIMEDAGEMLAEEYTRLRACDCYEKTQDVTPRCMESLIRLATAHAKCRLSSQINVEDAEFAIKIINYALFKKVVHENKRGLSDDEDDEVTKSIPKKTRKK